MKRLFTISLMLVASAAAAMPLRPDLLQTADRQALTRAAELRADAALRGLDRSGRSVLEALRRRRRDENAEVTLSIPVILIDFADNQADRQAHPADSFDRLLFSDGVVQTGSVRDFYVENSRGEQIIAGQVVGWYRAPQTYAYYTSRMYGLGNYPQNAQRLAEDAIRAADRDIDYGDFDNDGDGVVEAPFIVHAGGGAEEDPNNVNKIWSHAWQVVNLGALDGVRFDGYTMVPEDGRIGVFAHELGHALFGLPDLYDTQSASAGLGMWSAMAYGAWGDNGRRPVHFDAWCKLQLGWAEAPVPRRDAHFALPAAEGTGRALRLWHPDRIASEYFLAEYRDRSGFDGQLPAAGLLVYHVDEAMANNDNPWWPGHQGNQHNLVALEQADNRWDLETFENAGDAGDPFPGNGNVLSFDAESQPGSRDYGGNETGVAIRDITVTDSGIVADWVVGVEGPAIVRQMIALQEGWNLISLRTTPPVLDVRQIIEPLRAAGVLIFLKDGSGRFYAPEHDFINIPNWDVREGYYVKVSEDAELTVEGEEIEFDRPIPLHDGWQTAAYFPGYALSAPRGFGGLGGNLLMAKNGEGRFYLPRLGFNNMPLLAPGQGYLLRIAGDQVLQYPAR